MTEQKNLCIKPYPLGAHVEEGAVRFSFVSEKGDCGILIYDRITGKRLKKLVFEPHERIGNVYCKYLTDVDAKAITYQFYEGEELVPDRYAKGYAIKAAYGRKQRARDLRAFISGGGFDWEGDICPRIPYSESICYCAHVRGFTKHASSGVVHMGTFLGMVEKLDYLKEIGITTVELQPAYEFVEVSSEGEQGSEGMQMSPYGARQTDRLNYWGYKRGFYYAPKAAYAAGEDAAAEFKQMVKAFHRQGLEIVMQFYFPREVNPMEIPAILRFWVLEYHVDGFHLIGEDIPVEMIAADAALADTKLWHCYFNADMALSRGGRSDRRNIAVCQDDYLYVMRRYLKGDEDMLGRVLEQMRHIPERMGRIHYMSNYCSFTLMDMVSYDRKHNEANGEDNRDGSDYNCSWNCGEEGSSRRKKVLELRRRQIKNAMVMLLFSQSTPLIFMGDEFGNSQRGNNNPYCQDNSITWLDWNDLKKNQDIHSFWKQMVRLRREHPILHPERKLRIMDYISCGYPDLSYHGQNAWRPRTESYNRHIGIMYCGKYAKVNQTEEDKFFYLAMNMYWEPQQLALPKLPKGLKWELLCSTFEEKGAQEEAAQEGVVSVRERSISIYTGVTDGAQPEKRGRKKAQ